MKIYKVSIYGRGYKLLIANEKLTENNFKKYLNENCPKEFLGCDFSEIPEDYLKQLEKING